MGLGFVGGSVGWVFVLVCDSGWFCFVNCSLFGLWLDVLFVRGLVVCLLDFGCLLILISFD